MSAVLPSRTLFQRIFSFNCCLSISGDIFQREQWTVGNLGPFCLHWCALAEEKICTPDLPLLNSGEEQFGSCYDSRALMMTQSEDKESQKRCNHNLCSISTALSLLSPISGLLDITFNVGEEKSHKLSQDVIDSHVTMTS